MVREEAPHNDTYLDSRNTLISFITFYTLVCFRGTQKRVLHIMYHTRKVYCHVHVVTEGNLGNLGI